MVDGSSMHAFRASIAELCRELDLDSVALSLLDPSEDSPGPFLQRLWHAGFLADAALLLAHALTPPDAIWWGLVCVLALQALRPDPAVSPALDLIGDWSLSPSPELEEEAAAIADELEMKPPAAWIALAVSYSLPPEPQLAGRYRLGLTTAVAAAVQLAATMGPSSDSGAYARNLAFFLKRGFEIARGGDGGVDRLDPPSFPGLRRNPPVPRPWLEGR